MRRLGWLLTLVMAAALIGVACAGIDSDQTSNTVTAANKGCSGQSYNLLTTIGLENPVGDEQERLNIQFVVQAANDLDSLLSLIDPEWFKPLRELNNLRTQNEWDHDKNLETVLTVPE